MLIFLCRAYVQPSMLLFIFLVILFLQQRPLSLLVNVANCAVQTQAFTLNIDKT